LVGIGEASYSCVAPTIIGDLFTNEMRTKMLAVFYLAVPVGSGMGYIVGSNVAEVFGDWKWALRVTPPLGFICVLVLIFVVQEPKRGGAEGEFGMIDNNRTNLKEDIIYLIKKYSNVLLIINI
jgi:MFS family permease